MIQREIDYDRATQLRMIDDCDLPPTPGSDGTIVSSHTLRRVLRIIDSYARDSGECYASHRSIAQRADIGSTRTVLRAVQALQTLSIITCEGELGSPNRHRLVWSELALRRRAKESHPLRREVTPTYDVTSHKGIVPIPKSLIEPAEGEEQPGQPNDQIDWDRVEERAEQLSRVVAPRSVADALALCRIAVLMQTTIGDSHVALAAEQTRKKPRRNPLPYFISVILREAFLPPEIIPTITVPRDIVTYIAQGACP